MLTTLYTYDSIKQTIMDFPLSLSDDFTKTTLNIFKTKLACNCGYQTETT